MANEHLDVLVVGAGISGIGAGYYLQKKCPERSFAILEGRQQIGGTWDLFRYPGIRSDSDMHTLGYSFRPWRGDKSIADGPAILAYLQETAAHFGIDRKIRLGHRVESASWSSADNRWALQVRRDGQAELLAMSCNFLFMCSGYYRYEQGYQPEFAGIERFKGPVIHPQQWPADLDYAGKRVVVIGSGATAVTLVPALAAQAAHVTMLQRSPSYVVARPSVDPVGLWFKRWLPIGLAYALTRWKNVLLAMYVFRMCRSKPALVKRRLLAEARKALGPDYDIEKHFTPRYNPWDQRLCLVPDGDLFKAIRNQSVSVVTDQIAGFSAGAIKLASGQELAADLIVSATGLHMQMLAGIPVSVDAVPVQLARTFTYKGMMYAGVPNLASSFGYINASWTLRSDLTCNYVCRLLNHMKKTGTQRCTPRLSDPGMLEADWIDFSSGYIRRALAQLPKQGTRNPWTQNQNYIRDLMELRFGRVNDPEMEFAGPMG
jgi:monooxygenase